jgi:hypothetical protein
MQTRLKNYILGNFAANNTLEFINHQLRHTHQLIQLLELDIPPIPFIQLKTDFSEPSELEKEHKKHHAHQNIEISGISESPSAHFSNC